jgi:DNA-binding GntR family transcriptional regulator
MLWLLNQSDGAHSLLDIARRSQLSVALLREAAAALEGAGLLAPAPERGISAPRRNRAVRRAATSNQGRSKP